MAAFHFLKAKGETALAVQYANRAAPLIFEQPAQGLEYANETIAQYERALKWLDKYGNQLLDRKEDIYLFIHNADAENGVIDFEAWQGENVKRRQRIFEQFNLKKAAQAQADNSLLQHAAFVATRKPPTAENEDFERNKNGNYE